MKLYMIVRTNLDSPNYVISDEEPLQSSLNNLLRLAADPTSIYFINNEYVLYRLLDCTKLALIQDAKPKACPIMFDSWSCWNSTESSTTQVTQCPNFVNLGFLADRMATKKCTEFGTWWVHPATNRFTVIKIKRETIFSVGPGQTTQAAWTMLM